MTDCEVLVQYRLREARETLQDAQKMIEGEVAMRSIVNRASRIRVAVACLFAVAALAPVTSAPALAQTTRVAIQPVTSPAPGPMDPAAIARLQFQERESATKPPQAGKLDALIREAQRDHRAAERRCREPAGGLLLVRNINEMAAFDLRVPAAGR
ncbi:MAG: hypothetical protein AB1806_10395 [Acidobacteriota bacterium]